MSILLAIVVALIFFAGLLAVYLIYCATEIWKMVAKVIKELLAL